MNLVHLKVLTEDIDGLGNYVTVVYAITARNS